MRLTPLTGELAFPAPARLRVGDRFVFLPTVEQAIEWLEAPTNGAVRVRLNDSLALLLAARESRSARDMRTGYHAFMEGVIREGLVFR